MMKQSIDPVLQKPEEAAPLEMTACAEEEKRAPVHPEKSKKSLFVYLVALFALCAGLILLSYGTQLKMQKELKKVNENLTINLQNASGALEKAEAMATLAEEQRKEIGVLEEKLRTLTKERDDLALKVAELEQLLSAAPAAPGQ